MQQAVQQNILATAPIPKLIRKFAIPSVISMVVNALYNIVDQIFIGQQVGYLGNGATNVVFPISVTLMALAMLVGDGTAAYMSLRLGEGDSEKAEKGVCNSIALLAVISVVFVALAQIFLQPLLTLCGATAANMPYALAYGRIVLMGLPFVIFGIGLSSSIRADGSPRVTMVGMLIGVVTNIVLDYIFVVRLPWGVEGAALATIIGQALTCFVALWYIPRFKTVKIRLARMKPNFKIIKKMLTYGLSSFITQIAIVIGMLTINNMLVKYGSQSIYGEDIPLAVLGIVMKVNQILVSVVIGIAVGSQPIIGYNYGAKDYDRVKRTYKIAVLSAIAITTIGFIFFQFFPQLIINIFGSNEGALYNEFAKKCFRIFLALCMVNSFQQVSGVFFQSIGKPLKSAFIIMTRQILILVPMVLILPHFFGVEGILYAGPCADICAFTIALIFIVREMRHISQLQQEQLMSAPKTA